MTSINIQDYDPMTLEFSVRMEEFESMRHPEDGTPLIGESYFVQAEAPNGVRWLRHVGLVDWMMDCNQYGDILVVRNVMINNVAARNNDPTAPERHASALACSLQASTTRRLNPDVWDYAGACYGSTAYQALGIEEETAALEREAERWG